ncbi:MAG: hypothetical protein ACKOXT_03065 [Actinomycetota bacterium]
MDQSAALGGLTMLVIAGLWVVVFIPSWFQNRVNRQHNRQGAIELKSQVIDLKSSTERPKGKLVLAADRGRKLSRTKNLMSVLASLAFLGSATSAFFALQTPLLFVATGALVLVGLLTMLVAIKASSELRKLIVRVALAKTEIQANLASNWQHDLQPAAVEEADSRLWTPNPLPSPAYKSRIGELKIPTVATVTEINQSGKNFDTQEEINEILRRRRATA